MALALTFSAAIVSTVIVRAQEPAADSTKRKVKTRTMPEYPLLAKQMHITGKVKIEATIAADGHVVSTHVVGGSPMLVGAAIEALKRWRYEPGPKESSEIVEFDFDGSGS
jgi:protein TonB